MMRRRFEPDRALLTILGVGLGFRIVLALLLADSGHYWDVTLFRGWAENLGNEGLWGFFSRDFHAQYPPPGDKGPLGQATYVYVLYVVGLIEQALPLDPGSLLKVPALLSDVALGWLGFRMAHDLGAGRRASLTVAAVMVANPASWFDSIAWGQADSFGVLLLLAGVRELWHHRFERSAVLAVAAALAKPQFAILVPIVVIVIIRRLFDARASNGGAGVPIAGRAGWRSRPEVRLATTVVAGLATSLVISLPLGLTVPDLVRQVLAPANAFPYLSLNAYNPWALVTDGGRGIAATGELLPDWISVGPFTASTLGGGLFTATTLLALLRMVLRRDRETLLEAMVVIALAFAVLSTRVHERYLYPVLPMAAILAARYPSWRLPFVVISAVSFSNMYAVLVSIPVNPGVQDWLGVDELFGSPGWIWLAAIAVTLVLVWAVLHLWGRPSATPASIAPAIAAPPGTTAHDSAATAAPDAIAVAHRQDGEAIRVEAMTSPPASAVAPVADFTAAGIPPPATRPAQQPSASGPWQPSSEPVMTAPEVVPSSGTPSGRPWFGLLRVESLVRAGSLILVISAIAFWGLTGTQPGFYLDESAIAYNAWTILQSGTDENGSPWPFVFRSFGYYQGSVLTYLVSALFAVTGPSIFAARMVGAAAAVIAAGLIGWLALRITRSPRGAALVALTFILTPGIFEVSRLVLESTLMPLSLLAFLLILHSRDPAQRWSWPAVAGLAVSLAIPAYTYTAGRGLTPLLALGLIAYFRRATWSNVARTWLVLAVVLSPLIVYGLRDPGLITARLEVQSAIAGLSPAAAAVEVIGNMAANLNPWNLLMVGDRIERHHVQGVMGSILLGAYLLALMGLARIAFGLRGDPWWQFVVWGLVAAVIPTSLTTNTSHALHLIAFPVFLILAMLPALAWLLEAARAPLGHSELAGESPAGGSASPVAGADSAELVDAAGDPRRETVPPGSSPPTYPGRELIFIVLAVVIVAQGAWFQLRFHDLAPYRGGWFDAEFPALLDEALALDTDTIYLVDGIAPPYLHAYWYGVLRGVPASRFIHLTRDARPPSGAVVISGETDCGACEVLSVRGFFRLYRAP